jgi:hypothetical protein
VKNVGSEEVTLGGSISVPSGFTLTSGFGAATLAPGEMTSFTVSLEGASSGTYVGEVAFDASDSVEPFRFGVSGVVSAPLVVSILDNGDWGYTEQGEWRRWVNQGYSGDLAESVAGTGTDVARWEFEGLSAGIYRVSVTWVSHSNRATNAPYTVYDGEDALGTVRLNQKVAPGDFQEVGAWWEDLGSSFAITSGTLAVTLTDDVDGYVIADAVRIERVGDAA